MLEIWLWHVSPMSPTQTTHSHSLWRHVIWYTGTNILEQHAYSVFKEWNAIWAQYYSSVPQNETASLSNMLVCGNTFQWTAIVMVTAARTVNLTKRFLAWWRTDSQFQSMWLNKSHSRLMMDTSCQPDTPSQQMKHQVCEYFCIITGSNGQLLLYAVADGIHTALLTISCFLST